MNKFFLIIFFTSWQFAALGHTLNSADSIGVTTRNKEKFIVHEVEAGETLFSLSQKYRVAMDELTRINPILKEDGLKAGSRIFIPIAQQKSADVFSPSGGEIYHTVKPQETLFSISRQYGVSLGQIRNWNNLPDNNIDIGQKLLIKKANTDTSNGSVTSSNNMNAGNRKVHTVKPSETLYGISRIYDVTTDELRAWNNLPDNSISIGQQLMVSPPSGEKRTVSTGVVESREDHSSMLPASSSASTISASPNSGEKTGRISVGTKPETREPDVQTEDSNGEHAIRKVVEHGIAEVIDESTDTKKYLALHRTAPIGTIMQIKNEMNNQSVFVRVVGSIPDTGDNGKVLVKISKKAYERLGAVDPRFPVEISYIP